MFWKFNRNGNSQCNGRNGSLLVCLEQWSNDFFGIEPICWKLFGGNERCFGMYFHARYRYFSTNGLSCNNIFNQCNMFWRIRFCISFCKWRNFSLFVCLVKRTNNEQYIFTCKRKLLSSCE